MGATIHFKIRYHGLNFSSDSLDGFYNITTDLSNVTLDKDCQKNLPPYTDFTSKDFPSLQKNIDNKNFNYLSDLRVLYFRDLGANQQTWTSNQVWVKNSSISFDDAEKHTFLGLSSGKKYNAGYGEWINFAASGTYDINLQNNTDVYVILVIDSDTTSNSWYYPNILYCTDDYYNADTGIFSDGKPNTCARWCNIGLKCAYYPAKNELNIQTGMTDKSTKEVYINNFDTQQNKYISSTKYTTPFVLPSDYTDYPNIKHILSFTNLYEGKPSTPVTPPEQNNKIIIDFLHDEETTVHIATSDGSLKWASIATNPINYDFTKNKGQQVFLQTDVKPDSTKCITKDDTIYNIYYFKNGKPNDLDIKNYTIDYLNKNATTKYVTTTKSNLVEVSTVGYVDEPYKYHVNEKSYEIFKTPCSFNDYGYYLILPVELKDYYGVLVDNKGNVLQKVYPNRENKIEEKFRPSDKNTVIGCYDQPYNQVGIDLINYYYYHNKDYGITTKGYIDPNRYDNFVCVPFDLMCDDLEAGNLPAFELMYTDLTNIKTDLGGYYNPTTGKIDPITIKDNTGSSGTGGSSSSSSSTTGGSSSSTTGGSSGTTTGGSTTGSSSSTTTGGSSGTTTGSSSSTTTGGSTTGGSSSATTGGSTTGGSTTGGSSGSNPNTPTNLNNQIHLYSINQQNIIDLSTKDLSYQTSLNGFASYNANNFINQVYILPFGLPADLKENVSNIVTGLFKLDTDTVAIKQDHYDLDLGSITIKPKYNNGFDYNVTKCALHLPFTNLINLDINDVLNKTINIKYKVSLLNADTTVNILSDDNLIFTGKINIGTDLQLFSINSNNITGLLNSVLQNDVLVPYITITRNKPINNLVSYETNEHGQLSSYQGYLQTTSATVSCGTQEEQQEIENLLNGGIYIK